MNENEWNYAKLNDEASYESVKVTLNLMDPSRDKLICLYVISIEHPNRTSQLDERYTKILEDNKIENGIFQPIPCNEDGIKETIVEYINSETTMIDFVSIGLDVMKINFGKIASFVLNKAKANIVVPRHRKINMNKNF